MTRLLVILPSWVGDAVMATPALSLLRESFPRALIGALARPGIDDVLAGTNLLDEVHVDQARGVMGPKFAAAKLRPRRYEAALLLTNSFSTALIARIAGIPRRIGYARDARGLLLTDRLEAPRRADGRWEAIPAVEYYWRAAQAVVRAQDQTPLPYDGRPMRLATSPTDEGAADELLRRAAVPAGTPLAVLNPGANNPAKRWPPDRFGALADHLHSRHGLRPLITGSPAEVDLAAQVIRASRAPAVSLPALGVTLGALKALTRRARIMVTNDTGPRHFAAAFGIPVVTLFGPTDPRWTTIPTPGGEAILVADPSLPATELADDHPDRCRVDRIALESVTAAADRLLAL